MNEDDYLRTFTRRVEQAHAESDLLNDVPADLWQRVRVQTGNATFVNEGERIMHAVRVSPVPTSERRYADWVMGLNRMLVVVASVLIAASLAFAGWFAIGQHNGNDDPNRRFAVQTATPAASAEATPELVAATCEVEPLTVDRVMEIVKNPVPFIRWGTPGTPVTVDGDGGETGDLYVLKTDLMLVPGNKEQPSEEDFAAASEVANAYLGCLLVGTQGQVWTFYTPTAIQSSILAEFPVFANETDVRARVEERISQPATDGEAQWQDALPQYDVSQITANPDRLLAIQQASESRYYTHVIMFGVSIVDSSGTEVYLTNGLGINLRPRETMSSGPMLYFTMAKSRSSDVWFVIPWLSATEYYGM